jgi:hypothetical protein
MPSINTKTLSDIDHVQHAWKSVKPGGKLVAIMSAGVTFRENKIANKIRFAVKKGMSWRDINRKYYLKNKKSVK